MAKTTTKAPKPMTKAAAPVPAKVKPSAKASAPPPAKAAGRKAAPATEAKTKTRATAKAAPPPAKPVKTPTVTVKHLAAGISESRGMSRRDAEAFAVALVDALVEQVKGGAKVRIAGLGMIGIRDRAERMGRNPATGEPVKVAASRKVTFRAAKDLVESI